MRFSAVAVALAATPAIVSAAKGSMGFALGTKLGSGECKAQKDYEMDFDAIKKESGASLVRGYAASDCDMAKNALPAAKSKGFKVVLGIWYVQAKISYVQDKATNVHFPGPTLKSPSTRISRPLPMSRASTPTQSTPSPLVLRPFTAETSQARSSRARSRRSSPSCPRASRSGPPTAGTNSPTVPATLLSRRQTSSW
jgi:hypothetical protein